MCRSGIVGNIRVSFLAACLIAWGSCGGLGVVDTILLELWKIGLSILQFEEPTAAYIVLSCCSMCFFRGEQVIRSKVLPHFCFPDV